MSILRPPPSKYAPSILTDLSHSVLVPPIHFLHSCESNFLQCNPDHYGILEFFQWLPHALKVKSKFFSRAKGGPSWSSPDTLSPVPPAHSTDTILPNTSGLLPTLSLCLEWPSSISLPGQFPQHSVQTSSLSGILSDPLVPHSSFCTQSERSSPGSLGAP